MDEAAGYSVNELVARSGFDRRTIVYYIQQGILPRVGRRGPRTRYPAECLTRLLFVRGIKDHQGTGRLPGVTLGDMAYALSVLKADAVRSLVERQLPLAELETLFPQRPVAPVAFGRPMVGSATSNWRGAPPVGGPVAPSPAAAPATPEAPAARPSLVERAPADRRSYGLADAGIRQRLGVTRPPDATPPTAASEAPASGVLHEDTHPRLPALTLPEAAADGSDDLGELLRQLELRAGSARNRPPGAAEQWTEIPVTSRVYLSVRGLGEADAPLADAVARRLKRALRER